VLRVAFAEAKRRQKEREAVFSEGESDNKSRKFDRSRLLICHVVILAKHSLTRGFCTAPLSRSQAHALAPCAMFAALYFILFIDNSSLPQFISANFNAGDGAFVTVLFIIIAALS